jgi:ArsR family transcriptional regulator
MISREVPTEGIERRKRGAMMEFEVVGMEKKLYEMQAELCKTLSNPKRLEILDILKERKEISVNSLAEILEIPKANTSQHLAVLRQAGVVNTRKDGINVYYSLRSAKISEACSLTRQILLERLEDHVSLSDLIRKTGD